MAQSFAYIKKHRRKVGGWCRWYFFNNLVKMWLHRSPINSRLRHVNHLLSRPVAGNKWYIEHLYNVDDPIMFFAWCSRRWKPAQQATTPMHRPSVWIAWLRQVMAARARTVQIWCNCKAKTKMFLFPWTSNLERLTKLLLWKARLVIKVASLKVVVLWLWRHAVFTWYAAYMFDGNWDALGLPSQPPELNSSLLKTRKGTRCFSMHSRIPTMRSEESTELVQERRLPSFCWKLIWHVCSLKRLQLSFDCCHSLGGKELGEAVCVLGPGEHCDMWSCWQQPKLRESLLHKSNTLATLFLDEKTIPSE